ncbi:MAG TPA: Clp protease N-terminal domain-containing protein [Streptosporangiaceae bacterium]|nr:Clp protease N-terminal domain-containing protein [Streptosporangiaceae bacterium]
MFERFQADARAVVVRARDEAAATGLNQLGCEHLLVGLLEGTGPAADALSAAGLTVSGLRARLPVGTGAQSDPLDADALASIGIDLDQVRRATDATFGRGALDRARPAGLGRKTGRFRVTGEAKKALELAARTAVRLRQRHISAGHLLVGILDQGANAALTMLAASGVSTTALRGDVLGRMSQAA